MRRWLSILLVVILILGGAGWFIMQRSASQALQGDEATETAVVTRSTLVLTVGGAGTLQPVTQVSLAFKTGGRLTKVLVSEGEQVQAGAALAQLETADLELQVAQAGAGVAQAEAQLAQTQAGPRAEDIAAAKASLRSAQANYEKLATGSRPEDIAAAEAALRGAQANYNKVAVGLQPEEVTMAKVDLEKAVAALKRAQSDYNLVAWRSDIGALPQSQTLQQATQEYEKAQAAYDLKVKGASVQDLAVLKAQIDQAQAQLNRLYNGPTPAELAVAQAQVDQAQAQLEKLTHGPTAEELAIAQAQLFQANIALEQARLRLNDATLVAPAGGTVTEVSAISGAMVGTGAPLITLSSMAQLQMEINLDEIGIVQVTLDQPVQVRLDAFPGVELTGQVESIAPAAVIQSGVVLYPVTIGLAASDLPLRPGMTADATIVVASREKTLIVPFRAIETADGQVYVTRVTDATRTHTPVILGLITETEVEILDGLAEGDRVAVYANPVQDAGLQSGPGRMFSGGQ